MIQAARFGKTLSVGGTIGVAAAASPYDSPPTPARRGPVGFGVMSTLDADAKTLTVDEPALR